MYEVELKVPADHDAVRERLDDLGAERVDRVRQVDTYYAAPHRDFAETDEALRIREETRAPDDRAGDDGDGSGDDDTVHELTYKGPKVDAGSKTREEHESAIGDPDAVDAALRALGFEDAATVRKDRERYALRGYTVVLDAVDDLGTFVEVEREVPEDEIGTARDGAADLLADLGLDADDGIRTSYLGLLLAGEG